MKLRARPRGADTRFAAGLPHVQGRSRLTDRHLRVLLGAHDGRLATFCRSAGAGLPANSSLVAHVEVIDVV